MSSYSTFTTSDFSLLALSFVESLFAIIFDGMLGSFLATGGNITSSKTCDGTFQMISKAMIELVLHKFPDNPFYYNKLNNSHHDVYSYTLIEIIAQLQRIASC